MDFENSKKSSSEDALKNELPYTVEAPKTINEQRQDFVDEELKNAQKLIEMQKFSSDEERAMAIEKLKSSASGLFDSWAANIRAGITPDDLKFLDHAENPYNYMGMSAKEKMRLYDLQDRIKAAREGIEQEKSENKTGDAEKPRYAGKFIATESGLIVDTPVGKKYAEDLDKRAKAMNWDEIKKLEHLSQGEEDIEFTLKRIRDDADNLDSSPVRNDEKLATLRAAELFLRREQAKKRGQKNESNEKLEGEELFQYQIENNSHVSAKSLKEDLSLFIKSVDDMRDNFQVVKEELAEILYRNDLEYSEDKEVEVKKEDKEVLEPILNFRKELDNWNTLTEPKIDDFRKRILEYMKDVFGIETQEPGEGEKYDAKNMQAIKVEETKNEFLEYKIKKIISPGFKINGELFDYYKKWLIEKEQTMKEKHKSIKATVSTQEFDKITEEDQLWLKKHSFTKSIRPARVEIYRYKA